MPRREGPPAGRRFGGVGRGRPGRGSAAGRLARLLRGRGYDLVAVTLVLLLGCVTAGWGPAGHRCAASPGGHADGEAGARITSPTRDEAHGGPCLGCLLTGQLRASALPSAVVVVEARTLSPVVHPLAPPASGVRRTPRTARAPPLPL